MPEAEGYLAVGVIYQAFADAGLTGNNGPHHGMPHDKEQARAFLFETHGEWATARATWCAAADLCPSFVRDIALRLEADPSPRPRTYHRARENSRSLRSVTVERVKERIAYLRARGIDIATAKQQDAADVLNAGGFTTSRGHAYNTINVFELKHLFRRCVDMGEIEA